MMLKPSDLPAHLQRRLGLTPRSKYGVAPKADRTVDGITFDSKAEMRRYQQLLLMQAYGNIAYFLCQVPFRLPGNTRYVVDFMIVRKDGSITYEDVKGFRTQAFIRSKKQVEALYPVKIAEVRM